VFEKISNPPAFPLGENPIVFDTRPLGHGHTSQANLQTTSHGRLVVLEPHPTGIAPPDYLKQLAVLSTLEAYDYPFAPRPHPDSTADRLVMTFAEGSSIDWIEAAEPEVQKLAVTRLVEALLRLREVSCDAYAAQHHTHKGSPPELTSMLTTSTKTYVVDRFARALEGAIDPSMAEWLAPKVTMSDEAAATMPLTPQPILAHGDLSGPNILLDENLQLTLIDWEDAVFMYGPDGLDDSGLGHLLNHIPFVRPFREQMVIMAAAYQGIEPEEMNKIISWRQQLVKIGDVVWTCMMHAEAPDDKSRQSFLDIAFQRMQNVW
jgi:hypothetical protein